MNFKYNIQEYLDKVIKTINALNLDEIELLANLLIECKERKLTIFFAGNGGSALTAQHFASDWSKTLGLNCISLVDNIGLVTAYSNDCGYDNIFVKQLERLAKSGDFLISISGSGNSTNIMHAVEWCYGKGITTIGITGYDGGILKRIADYSVNVNVDDMQVCEDIHLVLCHLITRVMSGSGCN